jgi:hypothetical protein
MELNDQSVKEIIENCKEQLEKCKKLLELKELKELKELFKKYIKITPEYFKEVILNLLLVCFGIRSAFLYEETNYIRYNEKCNQFLFVLIDKINKIGYLKLNTKKDSSKFTRIFVYLDEHSRFKINSELYPVDSIIEDDPDCINIDDGEIAKILDFNCVGHDYSNQKLNRVEIKVYIKNKLDENEIYEIKAEVCEESKFSHEEANKKYTDFEYKINGVMNEFHYECFYTITNIPSFLTKLKMLEEKNIEFIKENLGEYISDLENFYISDPEELGRSTTLKKINDLGNTIKNDIEYTKLLNIYKKSINGEFDYLYEDLNYEEIKNVAKELSDKDIIDWANIKKDGKRKKSKKSKKSRKKSRKSKKSKKSKK